MHPVPLTSIYTKIEENNFDISNNYKQLHSFYCLGDYIYIIVLVLWFSILKYLQRKNSILHPLFSLILTPLTILIIRLMIDLTYNQ
ncbi:hypothetical protein DOY83_22970 [Shigella sonnei]|nr:hypothetical protein [Shigella sonnei]